MYATERINNRAMLYFYELVWNALEMSFIVFYVNMYISAACHGVVTWSLHIK